MPVLLFLLFVGIPIVELWILIQVGREIGPLPTIGLLLVVSAAGIYLLKQQGTATWRAMQASLSAGRMPTREVTDGFLILLGGALLLTPGFLTDAVGLLLLLPPTRAILKGTVRKTLGAWALGRAGIGGDVGREVYEARVVKTRRRPPPPHSTQDVTPEETPPGTPRLPDGGDGSPDTG